MKTKSAAKGVTSPASSALPAAIKRTGFVVMPFGEKEVNPGHSFNFDSVYDGLFLPLQDELQIQLTRCDKIDEPGMITQQMFRQLQKDDVVIVDLSTQNPNVFYELGVRHALCAGTTILVNGPWSEIPFNTKDCRVIRYDPSNQHSMMTAQKDIANAILAGLEQGEPDSPVHNLLKLQRVDNSQILPSSQEYQFEIRNSPGKHLGVITGSIRDVHGKDVWVNSENTTMKMARFHDPALSALIRYLGAEREINGNVRKDLIQLALDRKMKSHTLVPEAHVIRTTSGALKSTHGVKSLYHVAAVVGREAQGYKPVTDIPLCVRNLLDESADDPAKPRSLVMPLLGTGTAGGPLVQIAKKIIDTIIHWFDEQHRRKRDVSLEDVWIVNYRERELEVCHRMLRNDARLIAVK